MPTTRPGASESAQNLDPTRTTSTWGVLHPGCGHEAAAEPAQSARAEEGGARLCRQAFLVQSLASVLERTCDNSERTSERLQEQDRGATDGVVTSGALVRAVVRHDDVLGALYRGLDSRDLAYKASARGAFRCLFAGIWAPKESKW